MNCCWTPEGKKGHSCNLLVEVGSLFMCGNSVGTVVRKHPDGKRSCGKTWDSEAFLSLNHKCIRFIRVYLHYILFFEAGVCLVSYLTRRGQQTASTHCSRKWVALSNPVTWGRSNSSDKMISAAEEESMHVVVLCGRGKLAFLLNLNFRFSKWNNPGWDGQELSLCVVWLMIRVYEYNSELRSFLEARCWCF